MSRGLWFVAGAGAGAYAVSRARRLADSMTAEGLRARWQGITHGARLWSEDVRTAQAHRETELRESLGLPAAGPADRQLPGPASTHPTQATPINDRKNDH